MSRSVLLLALPLFFSCGRSTTRLLRQQPPSGPAADAGPSGGDAGIRKDGGAPADGGLPADAGIGLCPRLRGAFAIYGERQLEESGPAVVESVDPLVVRFFGGETIRFRHEGVPRLFYRLSPGQVVWAGVVVDMPWWTETLLGIYEIAPDDGAGRLLIAAWTTTDFEPPFETDELSLRYEDDACQANEEVAGCGEAVTRILVAEGEGRRVRIPPNGGDVFGDYFVSNGASYRYVPMPACTDTPAQFLSGYVAYSP